MYDIAIIFLIPLVHDTRYVPLNFEKLTHFPSVAALLFPNSCRTSILHERLYLTLWILGMVKWQTERGIHVERPLPSLPLINVSSAEEIGYFPVDSVVLALHFILLREYGASSLQTSITILFNLDPIGHWRFETCHLIELLWLVFLSYVRKSQR